MAGINERGQAAGFTGATYTTSDYSFEIERFFPFVATPVR